MKNSCKSILLTGDIRQFKSESKPIKNINIIKILEYKLSVDKKVIIEKKNTIPPLIGIKSVDANDL